ncbi:hypothetical protein JCM14720_19510 [Calditerricola yamamurae]
MATLNRFAGSVLLLEPMGACEPQGTIKIAKGASTVEGALAAAVGDHIVDPN